ncbi:MAG: hypothetical protein DSY81_06665 [Bacillota bacterium]|nr:MAG: hypothetical protein DSY92_04885 [Planctomycetota bacterium]RUA09371.1 MAG: hypothetical protein DSY81_06665 [Bacillota bacterium]
MPDDLTFGLAQEMSAKSNLDAAGRVRARASIWFNGDSETGTVCGVPSWQYSLVTRVSSMQEAQDANAEGAN